MTIPMEGPFRRDGSHMKYITSSNQGLYLRCIEAYVILTSTDVYNYWQVLVKPIR